MKNALTRVLVTTLGLCLVGAAIVAYLWFRDYGSYFVGRKGMLDFIGNQPATGDSVFRKSWLTLRNRGGFVVECGMLVPRAGGRLYPAIVLLGGKATGKYAVDYAIGISNVIIIAPDYPYDPRPSYTLTEFLVDVPAMRTALIDMVPSVMLVLDYLHQREDVDTNRIVLLGYSFGAPLVPPIIAHDRRVDVAAIVYGGGDLHSLIRHNVRRYEGPLMSEFVAFLGGLLLRPVEPLRYAKDISPTPLLMINGTQDDQIPRENTERLYAAAGDPKDIVWLDSRHVHPRNVELTRRIIGVLEQKLREAGIL